jgi:hypothetical protein
MARTVGNDRRPGTSQSDAAADSRACDGSRTQLRELGRSSRPAMRSRKCSHDTGE